jgi:FlaA1/EpsC-like NDP-sugar epimerase
MTRYFMSIEEAAQLILQAGAMGGGGEIFILKMGASVKIVNLARDLIKMLGYEPEKEIKIQFTGLRPGEKLYEELITEGEGIVPTKHEKIMVLQGDGRSKQEIEELLTRLSRIAAAHDSRGIKAILKLIIPEYLPDLDAKPIVGPHFIDTHELCN